MGIMNKKHGSPFDRGGSDSWYRRPKKPHKWTFADSSLGTRIDTLTKKEIAEYHKGYDENEKEGGHKEWN